MAKRPSKVQQKQSKIREKKKVVKSSSESNSSDESSEMPLIQKKQKVSVVLPRQNIKSREIVLPTSVGKKSG